MKIPLLLCEDDRRLDLLPFTFTRPVWDLRFGIFTQRERWEAWIGEDMYCLASGYLAPLFHHLPTSQRVITVNSGLIPDLECLRMIAELGPDEWILTQGGDWLAANVQLKAISAHSQPLNVAFWEALNLHRQTCLHQPLSFRFPEDLFRLNGDLIRLDFPYACAQAPAQLLRDPHTRVYGADNLYLAPGAKVRAAILNAEDGPIYLGPDSLVSEGAIIARTHALCANATVAMGAKLRGDTTVGPWSKVGGEVGNSVIMGFSNKGHEGYLGNSVIGHWCNLGADTNTSNLKNNYAEVRLWHYPSGGFRRTGLQFCGLMMADHSKCGINTMFNTGTVVGVSANIFGAGFPRNFVPSFSWGGVAGFTTYQFAKALEVAKMVKERRGEVLSEAEIAVMQAVFDLTAPYRKG